MPQFLANKHRISRRQTLAGLATSLWCAKPAFASTELKFTEIYKTGVELSEKAKSLTGQTITISGFMAPPLKAEVNFFVLTKIPMAVCPFCDSALDWPDDIVLVKMHDVINYSPFNRRIIVVGVLETGFAKDTETGFVSFVRLTSASYSTS